MIYLDGQPFTEVDVAGDGNCLFRALSVGLSHHPEAHRYLRNETTDYVAAHWLEYEAIRHEEYLTVEEYVAAMKLDGVYGGYVETLAAAELFNVRIKVFQRPDIFVADLRPELMDTIYLYFNARSKHYTALLPAADTSTDNSDKSSEVDLEYSESSSESGSDMTYDGRFDRNVGRSDNDAGVDDDQLSGPVPPIAYNTVLSMAIPRANYGRRTRWTESVVTINGVLTLRAPAYPSLGDDGLPCQSGQLFFVDVSEESLLRRAGNSTDPGLRFHVLEILERYLRRYNDLVRTFVLAGDVQRQMEAEAVEGEVVRRVALVVNPHKQAFRVTDRTIFQEDENALRPAGSEAVAAVFVGGRPEYRYDMVYYPRNVREGGDVPYVSINESSPMLDSLMYPLIHLHAEDSWTQVLVERRRNTRPRREVGTGTHCGTLRQYYSARLMVHRGSDGGHGVLMRCRGLYQQWLCDAAVKIMDANLRYAETHQDELQVCMYDSLKRFVNSEAERLGRQPGRIVILPPSEQKSERQQYANYMDSVCIASKYGAPDLFMTMTANPRWPEIVACAASRGLADHEFMHMPDVVVRAYLGRVNALMHDVVNQSWRAIDTGVLDWDEILHCRDMRLVGPYEACFRIFGLPFAILSHSVQTLPIHLPDKQYVYYRGDPLSAAQRIPNSKLLAWFALNAESESARVLLYAEVVTAYKWEDGKWKVKGPNNCLGRLMHVSPSKRNLELFHLRLIILNVRGATHWDDLLTVDGTRYTKFQDASIAFGISSGDEGRDYDNAMNEVVRHATPWQLRRFFATLIYACDLRNTAELWEKHRDAMAAHSALRGRNVRRSDIVRAREEIISLVMDANSAFDRESLEEMLPIDSDEDEPMGEGLDGEANNPPSSDVPMSDTPSWPLTEEQQTVFDAIMDAVRVPDSQVINHRGFAVMAPAGCGKTVLFSKLLATCRADGMPAIACAVTAIAALLFVDGETCHKTFGIPIRGRTSGEERSFLENSSEEAEKLRKARLILIDEVYMLSAEQAILIDELLRMVMGKPNLLFGGKCVVFGGDMAQVLPVIRGLSPRAVAEHTVRAWVHWPQLRKFSLTRNMRAQSDPEFAAWLEKVRDGSANINGTDAIVVPQNMLVSVLNAQRGDKRSAETRLTEALVQKVFGDLSEERCRCGVIVSPTNDAVIAVNDCIVAQIRFGR
ncbi:ATP-dependent DNA helicase PIF7 [Frankliniella fusca]|uniref:ATP-dependent DNA helicase n=1 Tax=Frankliniella fusca TaxID=407009 RepID=A0AAE1GYS4_9NEOP|nr:ATP-dependent DNA helicase PIF7 [Frankliniella fusca]